MAYLRPYRETRRIRRDTELIYPTEKERFARNFIPTIAGQVEFTIGEDCWTKDQCDAWLADMKKEYPTTRYYQKNTFNEKAPPPWNQRGYIWQGSGCVFGKCIARGIHRFYTKPKDVVAEFPCPHCPAVFSTQSALDAHIRIAHPEVKDKFPWLPLVFGTLVIGGITYVVVKRKKR